MNKDKDKEIKRLTEALEKVWHELMIALSNAQTMNRKSYNSIVRSTNLIEITLTGEELYKGQDRDFHDETKYALYRLFK